MFFHVLTTISDLLILWTLDHLPSVGLVLLYRSHRIRLKLQRVLLPICAFFFRCFHSCALESISHQESTLTLSLTGKWSVVRIKHSKQRHLPRHTGNVHPLFYLLSCRSHCSSSRTRRCKHFLPVISTHNLHKNLKNKW